MSEPVLLDLYCAAGGAAAGYEAAGFKRIVGVDNKPQPHYPYEFVQADALEYLAEHGHEFAAVHASPPCQGYSIMHNLPWLRDREYPLLLKPTVEMLDGLGKPYVVENVMGAKKGSKALAQRGIADHGLEAAWLCGAMFGLPFYRHRLFASNWLWMAPAHPRHQRGFQPGHLGGHSMTPGQRRAHSNPVNTPWRQTHDGVGAVAGWRHAAEAMGISWMNREELTQAIPPVFTEHIGLQLLALLALLAHLETSAA